MSSYAGVESWVSSRGRCRVMGLVGDRQEARSVHPLGVEPLADVDGPRFEGRGLSGWCMRSLTCSRSWSFR